MSFPTGIKVAADDSLERHDDGRLLMGGFPPRLLRLAASGAERLDGWLAGETVGSAPADRRLAGRLIDAGVIHPQPDPAMGPPPAEVTVVVPVLDDPSGLSRMLAALADGPAGRGVGSVIVVDDGSADPGAIAAAARRHGAALAARSANGGPGAARNTGLADVTTPLTVFADADAVVSTASLRALLAHFADPQVVAAAPRVRSETGPSLLARYEAGFSPLDMGASASPVGPDRRVRYVPATVLAVRTEAARSVGGFDERLRLGEDVDFVWRLVQLGHAVRYEPGAAAAHPPRDGWRALLRQRRRYGTSAAPVGARHPDAASPARCPKWSAAAWAAAALGLPGAAAAIAGASGALSAGRVRSAAGVEGWAGWRLAARLALRNHGRTGLVLARAVTRAWWPVLLAASVRKRSLRRSLVAAAVVPALLDWLRLRRRPPGPAPATGAGDRVTPPAPLGPATTVALRLVDDLAYSVGLWQGVIAHRRRGPAGGPISGRAGPDSGGPLGATRSRRKRM